MYAEEALCLALARRLKRPVRWIEERSESTTATIQGRGMIQDIELAADADGRITAVRVHLLADMGAYLQLVTPGIPLLGAFVYHGVYDIPAYSFTCTGVFTNRTPTDAYRGAGRPEATYAIERSIDVARARRSVSIRPRSVAATSSPTSSRTSTSPGCVFDSGDYEGALDKALELVDYDGVRARAGRTSATRATAKHLGIGLSSYVEMCGLAPSRVLASLRLRRRRLGVARPSACCRPGKVQVVTGTYAARPGPRDRRGR